MIFLNPAGMPELACDHCGCRWFDRIAGTCYECGTPVDAGALAEYGQVLAEHVAGPLAAARQGRDAARPAADDEPGPRGGGP